MIVEPFQRLLPPAPGFLQGLAEVTKQHGIPLIFDEIVTGFRLAYGGAQEYYGVTPDLCALGKVVAGGFPLAAVAGREEIMSHFDAGEVQAGLATLKVLRREGTYDRLFESGNRVKEALQRLLDETEIPARVVGEAPVFDVFFTDSDITDYRSSMSADKQKLGRFNRLLRERGVLKGDSKFYVSTAHTDEDIELTLDAFDRPSRSCNGNNIGWEVTDAKRACIRSFVQSTPAIRLGMFERRRRCGPTIQL